MPLSHPIDAPVTVPSYDHTPFLWLVAAKTHADFEKARVKLHHGFRGVLRHVSSPDCLKSLGTSHVGFIDIDSASLDPAISDAWCDTVEEVRKASPGSLVFYTLTDL
jgi:hypothetical protein